MRFLLKKLLFISLIINNSDKFSIQDLVKQYNNKNNYHHEMCSEESKYPPFISRRLEYSEKKKELLLKYLYDQDLFDVLLNYLKKLNENNLLNKDNIIEFWIKSQSNNPLEKNTHHIVISNNDFLDFFLKNEIIKLNNNFIEDSVFFEKKFFKLIKLKKKKNNKIKKLQKELQQEQLQKQELQQEQLQKQELQKKEKKEKLIQELENYINQLILKQREEKQKKENFSLGVKILKEKVEMFIGKKERLESENLSEPLESEKVSEPLEPEKVSEPLKREKLSEALKQEKLSEALEQASSLAKSKWTKTWIIGILGTSLAFLSLSIYGMSRKEKKNDKKKDDEKINTEKDSTIENGVNTEKKLIKTNQY